VPEVRTKSKLVGGSAGTADVRKVFEQAKNQLKLLGRQVTFPGDGHRGKHTLTRSQYSKTVLFIDEIHRFTKPQQDLFLPFVENGWVQLIGATTENPSFKGEAVKGF
jgi:putative ATPase